MPVLRRVLDSAERSPALLQMLTKPSQKIGKDTSLRPTTSMVGLSGPSGVPS